MNTSRVYLCMGAAVGSLSPDGSAMCCKTVSERKTFSRPVNATCTATLFLADLEQSDGMCMPNAPLPARRYCRQHGWVMGTDWLHRCTFGLLRARGIEPANRKVQGSRCRAVARTDVCQGDGTRWRHRRNTRSSRIASRWRMAYCAGTLGQRARHCPQVEPRCTSGCAEPVTVGIAPSGMAHAGLVHEVSSCCGGSRE